MRMLFTQAGQPILSPAGLSSLPSPPCPALPQVTVHTSDLKGAGTDASVFLELRGERGSSGQVPLSGGGEAAFERGGIDCFTLRLPRLGTIHEAVVGHDGRSMVGAALWRACY